MTNTEIVRASFDCYQSQDRDAAEKLIAQKFSFTSPQDDHIDRDAYFERCFPTADRFADQTVLYVMAGDDENVVAVYGYELHNGERYRNTELHRVVDGQIEDIQVFFGGRVN